MLQHYFHETHQFRTKRRNLREFKMNSNKNQKFICMSNGSAIQIYQITAQSVDYYFRKQFFCNIAKLEVVPSLHHDSDYIFILDDLGRFCFWHPQKGQIQTCNVIKKQNTSKRFYRQQLSPEEEEEFSGVVFKYEVKDTIGHIFFTIQNKFIVLSTTVKLKQGLKIKNKRIYEIPYTRFRFVNCLSIPSSKNQQLYLGIIQEIEQKTFLKIHSLNLDATSALTDEDSLCFKIEKINLLSFQSGENNEIIVLTYDQISIYKFKQNQYICNYRTRGNYGSVCYISPIYHKATHEATYIHLGHDMTAFTKSRLHSYGPLKIDGKNLLQNRGIIQSKYLGHVANGQVMLGFITNFSEVYFVLLYQNKWRLIRQIKSLSSIFSIHQLSCQQNEKSMIVVHASEETSSEVTHLEITNSTILDQEQVISNKLIESIDIVQSGESIVVSNNGQSFLLRWQKTEQKWIQVYNFSNMKEQILACVDSYVVIASGIYKYNINSQGMYQMTHLLKEENILSAMANKQYIGYYTSEGNYKYYERQSNSVARIRKNCLEQYVWHLLSNRNILISAAYNEPGQLRILPVQKTARKIQLSTKELISSISSIYYGPAQENIGIIEENSDERYFTDLIVGYYNGQIQIFSFDKNKTIAKFHIGHQMVCIVNYRPMHLVLYTRNRQFILSKQTFKKNYQNPSFKSGQTSLDQYKLHQVQFCEYSQSITKILYLTKFDKFLIILSTGSTSQKDSLLQLRSLKLRQNLSDGQFNLQLNSSISMKTIFKAQSEQGIPFVLVHDERYAYIALSQFLLKYCIRTKKLIKKQLHLLKQITGIQKIQGGVIVAGVDVMDAGSIFLFDFEDLTIKVTHGTGVSKPLCMKGFQQTSKLTNKFFVHHETYITLFENKPTHLITPLKTINTKTISSSIDLNEKYNKLVIADQLRYLSVWDYDLEKTTRDFIPVSKYFGAYTINDCCWIGGAVATGDRGGILSVLEFNLGASQDLHKINMTKVAQISIGEQIFALKRVQEKHQIEEINQKTINLIPNSSIYYGTASGTIGMLKTINEKEFKLLKQIQLEMIKYIDLKEHFSYQQWRKRIPKDDKLIDSCLIKYYLDQFKMKIIFTKEDFYNQVVATYNALMIGSYNCNQKILFE